MDDESHCRASMRFAHGSIDWDRNWIQLVTYEGIVVSKQKFKRAFRRSSLSLALGLTLASVAGTAAAQSAVGSIFGDTTSNSTVRIESIATGLSREVAADASGRFTFSQLPPGRYRVTSGGTTREVQVSLGTGTEVDFVAASGDATTLGTITVTGSAINPIDVSSVESATVFTAEQIDTLPIGRDVTSVALLAPGTVRGDSGFGNLASFGGASVAENGYYINGFDVTNIRNFVSFAELPFEAIAEQQIKTGGYGAEYGRALGGIISIVTKRGTNEWTGGASVYWSPSELRADGRDVLSRDPDQIGSEDPYYQYRSDDEFNRLSYNVFAGGPLIKDRLFVFGIVEVPENTTDYYYRDDSEHRESDTPNGLLKLDWYLSDNHTFEFTGIYNKSERKDTHYINPEGELYTGEHGMDIGTSTLENGGEVYIGRYTGYLSDSFTLSVLGGYLVNTNNFTPELPGSECPAIYDSRAPGFPLNHLGCWNEEQFTVREASFGGGPDEDKRTAFRVDGEWFLGDHRLRFGLDKEKFESSHAGSTYSGGVYYRYFDSLALFGVDLGDVVRRRIRDTESGTFEVINSAAYVEDNWQVSDNWLLYLGLRAETFENKNGAGQTFVKSDTLIAPRLGFSWDVNGDSTFKVFGNAGRYHIPVASNTNIRASSAEYSDETWFLLEGVDPVTGEPTLGEVIIPTEVNGSLTPPDTRTVAATNLDPMYQDEYILGFQHQLGSSWSIGVRAISREVKAGFDDTCSHNGFNQWAADNGFDPDFALDGEGIDMAGCFLINPGQDVELAMDPDNDGDLEVYNVSASYIGLPKYSRKYNAVELFWERVKTDNWYLQGSYTYAKSKGNVEGYVNSSLEQDDAGLTQDFDFAAFEHGAYGYLPNDRRHTLKLFGAYEITDEWTVSANLLVQSGRPVSCYGFIPVDALGIGQPDAGTISAYSGSSFYCADPNGDIVDPGGDPGPADDVRYRLGNRGDQGRTPWTRTFDLGIGYTPNWANDHLELQMKVFNVFNADTVTEYNEFSADFRTQTVPSPDFLNDQNYQSPRSVRFAAKYTW